MGKERKSKEKKGCLPGCLFGSILIIVLVAVLAVFGYLNRYTILPFVSDKMGLEVSSVIPHAGSKATTGMPSEFLDKAYKIDLPQGNKTVRITTSDVPADQTYDRFLQYFQEGGWEVKKEMEALGAAPKQVENVSQYFEEEIRAAELVRDGQQLDLAVTRYNDETVGAVWHSTAMDFTTIHSE